MNETIGQCIAAALRTAAEAFVAGDKVAPCVVLWTDPERLWEPIVPELYTMLPELFVLGSFAPESRSGPALWLRCIEARVVDGAPPAHTVPIFYLPGISHATLRAAEDCPKEFAPLVELQYRGIMWLNHNQRDWTPQNFLSVKSGGLGLDVAKDKATHDALVDALPALFTEPLSRLKGRRLDSEFFNELLAPDAIGLLLRWLSDTESFKQRHSATEWKAFCELCKVEFHFDPVKDGPLRGAALLASRSTPWDKVWKRFAEAPKNYPGIVIWLKRAAPKEPVIFDSAEVWPDINEMEERKLQVALESLSERHQDEVIRNIAALEIEHGKRREYPWQKLGLSPFATALGPLSDLAALCNVAPGAPDAEGYAQYYISDGWRVDAAAIATLASCGAAEQHAAILGSMRAVYLPWLESTARHLQNHVKNNGQALAKRFKPIETAAGRLVFFADGLRMDTAKQLTKQLTAADVECALDWEWSTIPSVTASAKPAASPLTRITQGGEAGDKFTTRLITSGKTLTQDRFITALKEHGWQFLGTNDTGDPSGSAWTEAGSIDKIGHSEGWKLARSVDNEVRDLASRIRSLLEAGWAEIIVVTDHGWLLLPGGLPKVEIKAFLTEDRWGRCASMKGQAQTEVPTYKWHWNPDITIACPAGVGCFRAGMEYSHGGISLQEMVTPVIRVKGSPESGGVARVQEYQWTGAKCRLSIVGRTEGLRVDIRTSQSDPGTSLLSDKLTREIPPGGIVTVFLNDDGDIGKKADIVLVKTVNKNEDILSAISITLGE